MKVSDCPLVGHFTLLEVGLELKVSLVLFFRKLDQFELVDGS